ncbi:DNA-binding transcriptional LysR family regulator [Marinobacterium sp. MBR-111]|jgi:DNA-binding transcriptional LysR family regulator|uniref:LysR family transcriptional regulator n=1 Tax=Marinobacterium sp. MBR-111 TaxID=3156463 RepID=UPI00339421C3
MLNIDLNLIRTFVVLYETRSVTISADKLAITQPSVSYALSRLRKLFEDPLFIRSKLGMEPTVVAIELYPVFSRSLSDIEHSVERCRNFEAALSERRFTIALTDLGEMVQLPLIFNALNVLAPKARLNVVPLQIDNVVDWMQNGKVDAVICSTKIIDKRVQREVIHSDSYVCVAGRSAEIDHLTLEAFEAAGHIEVSRSQGHGLVEAVILARSIQRDVRLSVPHFSSLPSILAISDLLAVVPENIAQRYVKDYGLKVFPLPFPISDIEIAVYWSTNKDGSPATKWFIEVVKNALIEGW